LAGAVGLWVKFRFECAPHNNDADHEHQQMKGVSRLAAMISAPGETSETMDFK
jgi:hypothetical protein